MHVSEQDLSDLRQLVGESHRIVEDLEIERGKVEEFAHAIKNDDGIHHDVDVACDRGYPAIPAPLTFTRTGYFPRYHPDELDVFHGGGTYFGFDIDFDPERTVHAEQSYEYERPMFVGDTLTGTATLAEVFTRDRDGGGVLTFAVFETEYRDSSGELVQTETTTFVETPEELSESDS
jgi:hypothetical protein